MKGSLLVVLLFLFVPVLAHAQIGYWVDINNTTGPWDGTYEYPFQYINDAIDNAYDGINIMVKPGVYPENINYDGIRTHINSQMGPEVTIIDGMGLGSVVTINSSETDICLDGFTITNGNAISGGGIFYSNNNPASIALIQNNIICNNTAQNGSGVSCSGPCSPVVKNNIIRNNLNNSTRGGGVYVGTFCNAVIDSNLIYSNEADNGGGVSCEGCFQAPYPVIANNIIYDNHANIEGGGANFLVTGCNFVNNTFGANTAPKGAWVQIFNAYPTLQNTIFHGMAAISGNEINIEYYSWAEILYCNVQGGQGAVTQDAGSTLVWMNNMDQDPLFADPDNGWYHLDCQSPCIDAGDNLAAHLPSHDFDGDDRILDGDDDGTPTVDMGADEFLLPIITDVDTISAATGGTVNFSLRGGPYNGARNYLLLGGTSGTTPGTLLPGGLETVPINFDWFTDLILANLNTPMFWDFLGVLDDSGIGQAVLNSPPLANGVGTVMHFSFVCNDPFDYASFPPKAITIVP